MLSRFPLLNLYARKSPYVRTSECALKIDLNNSRHADHLLSQRGRYAIE